MKIAAILMVLAVFGLAFLYVTRSKSVLSRTNILVGTSPLSVWSWNKSDGSITLILLPSDIASDSSQYGRYSLEALWKLGFIDGASGAALAKSLTNTLAMPLYLFIGEGDGLTPTADPKEYGQQTFSLSGAMSFLLGRRRTNIPWQTYARFSWALSSVLRDTVDVIDLANRLPVANETLPDGTKRQFFDIAQVDVLLEGRFEDEKIRKEGHTVAIYNTTTTPALGTYAARLLNRQGVLVVAVGNSEPQIEECRVEASEAILESSTAKIISELFTCQLAPSESQERADILVRLGSAYASQFASVL